MKTITRCPGTPSREPFQSVLSSRPRRRVAALLAALFCSLSATACEDLTVRDAAFAEPRDVHKLFVIATGTDPKGAEIERRLTAWLIESASGLNVALQRIDASDPNADWAQVGIPSAPPSLPVVVLVGNDTSGGRTFYIQHWEPEPTPEDLRALLDSPARAALRSKAGNRMAMFLRVPGTIATATDTDVVLNSAIADWSGRERLAVEKLSLDRTDPNERILISFLGVPEEGPDWLGVVFGKGKIMPPLEGAEINAFGLNERLAALAAECTCLTTAANLGVDIPMVWSGTDTATFQPLREPAAPERSEDTIASVDWSPLKSTGIVLAGLAGVALLGGVVLVFRRLGGDSPSLAR